MKIVEFITDLSAKGYNSFTSIQARKALGVSEIATRAAIRRLKVKGVLAQPAHGFYVIVPPEYRILGCRPAEHFITELMEYLGEPYYVGLLTAAQYYGAAHHRPQQYQVITNQKRRTITCGNIKIVFITKKSIESIPTQQITTPNSIVKISSPEVTAMDLVIYSKRCGGLDNVLTVIKDLANKIDAEKLAKLTSRAKEIAWAQRLGYLLDSIKATQLSKKLEEKIKNRNTHPRILIPVQQTKKPIKFSKKVLSKVAKCKKTTSTRINKKWKLLINKKLEPDT